MRNLTLITLDMTQGAEGKIKKAKKIIDVEDVNAMSHHGNSGENTSDDNNPHEHSRKNGKDRSRQRAIKAAEKFKPKNPSFTALVRRSNLTHLYMNVPASFAQTYMRKLDSVEMEDSGGQRWAAPCHRHGNSVRMNKGWSGFARTNNVREGDVCVFELVKRKNNVVQKLPYFVGLEFGNLCRNDITQRFQMRSNSRSRRRSYVRPSVSPSNAEPNHFLKIILPGAIHLEKLRIPREFLRRFGNDLSNEVMITVPDGLVWKMGLEKSANEVWFCNHWQEFSKYYSISYGSFLIFKYVGNSNFCVVIIDMSSAEIYYPCKNQSNNEEQEEIICVDDANAPSHGKSGTSVSYNPRPRPRGNASTKENLLRKKQSAIEAAQKFKPKNPSFTVILRPTNVSYYLNVPASFSRTYMRKPSCVKLQDSNGQQWVVSCYRDHGSVMRMSKGWINFARAKNLREGDVCVFELIERKKIVLKVTIFPWT
ncbi:B3 domain-containing transcription factor VRN1-like [Senna tora]|uniref:B3 domain-containing transcription factor VRN1-like n=1 Tax=Senna tora TaxID=362788 RepID=A0A834SCF2_9FABA|nr:B3 domain-containing transcription factor VRN1-like [Senna tora]